MSKKRPATLRSQAGSMVYARRAPDNKPNVASSADEGPQTIIQHPEFFFDNTLIAIQIENTMFNVHKYQLAKSEVFSDMFQLPEPEGDEPEEGSSPKHPIVIEGVSASDFAALLKVLYASHFSSNQPAPEAALIIPAFRLANMFNFSELRAFLLPLAEKSLADVDKIVFAREFDIKEWLAPAFARLCEREERLGIEEARKLEVDSVLMISHMREQYRSRGSTAISGRYYCYNCVGMSYNGGATNCAHCSIRTSSILYCNGAGTMGTGTNTNNTSIEAEVNKWVEENYVSKK
ncbi:BTB/POZ domain protein [Rhizoctonia solani AG-3 Rhs1AP]|uniref:BTB/POZ domain protein n=2 Tax=Rhizoctonia solani AG-3 TaxID=1086053 RepID=A0A074RN08_9AGAM|nr:BTB/POZ domain protein [Rhizoctonia solani AG-3 Rhs1AP]KEP48476.1 BTB/POZ domain protein [Rhizoctonia solani 123E]